MQNIYNKYIYIDIDSYSYMETTMRIKQEYT